MPEEAERERNHERETDSERDGEEFYRSIRFQWENELKHFITGRYYLNVNTALGYQK